MEPEFLSGCVSSGQAKKITLGQVDPGQTNLDASDASHRISVAEIEASTR